MSFESLSLAIPGTHVALVAGALLALGLLSTRYRARRRLPYPPGPKPLPLLGNILDIPRSQFALTWSELGRRYGPLTWLTVPGQTFLVVNSFEAAKELLEKRGSIYLDRPRWVMLKELIGVDYLTQFSGCTANWRKQRARLKQALSATVIERDYASLLETKARQFLNDCLVKPEHFLISLNRNMTEVVIELTYGRLGDGKGSDYIHLSSFVADVVLEAMQGYVVDLVPAVRYLPHWLPGMKFKRDAAKWNKEVEDIRKTAFETAKQSAISGDSSVRPSYLINSLKELYQSREMSKDVQHLLDEEIAIGHSGFSFFVAGVETTQFSVESFLLAMALFPSVQKKAHAELDRIVGSDRPPVFADQKEMSYLHAVLLETLRWNPVAAVGAPHTSLKDDVYEGYFIPKGTAVIGNAWGISRDTKYYSDPSMFDPGRYLKQPPALDPREFVFGYGRRICPGIEFGFQAMWILAASILWAFEVTISEKDAAALQEDTKRFSFGMLSRPMTSKCQFVLRREGIKDSLGFSTAEASTR